MKALRLVLSIAVLLAAFGRQATAADAETILRKIDDLWRGISSHAVLTMNIVTRHYRRTLRVEAWSKGRDLTLVKILSPLKERGTATLRRSVNVYTYLPRTDRVIKITSGMMMSSWMGSHFTNDDLVKESRLSEDYHARVAFEGLKDGVKVIELELTPKEEAAVVWGGIRVTVRASDYIPLRAVYYDEDGKAVRVMTFARIKKTGKRTVPTLLRLDPLEKPGEYTELLYEELTFDVDIPDSFFTITVLRRR